MEIDRNTARRLQRDLQLRPPLGMWHYSSNEILWPDKFEFIRNDRFHYLCATTLLNEWAPAAFFTDDPGVSWVVGDSSKKCPFWHLSTVSFEKFLSRRSAVSANPKKNFPSIETYSRRARKLQCSMLNAPLFDDPDFFIETYSQLKLRRFAQDGQTCIDIALHSNPGVPRNWFQFYVLRTANGDCKAVVLVVNDGKSASMLNIAAAREGGAGYGTFILTQIINDLCQRSCSHFDAGVSGHYGHYKNLIFIDSMQVKGSAALQACRSIGNCAIDTRADQA